MLTKDGAVSLMRVPLGLELRLLALGIRRSPLGVLSRWRSVTGIYLQRHVVYVINWYFYTLLRLPGRVVHNVRAAWRRSARTLSADAIGEQLYGAERADGSGGGNQEEPYSG